MLKINKIFLSNKINFESVFVSMLFVGLVVLLYYYNLDRAIVKGTDTAGFIDLINSVVQDGSMVSSAFGSFYSIWPFLSISPTEYCAADFIGMHDGVSFSIWHPYLIVYLLSAISFITGLSPADISAIVNAVNIAGAMVVIYAYLRYQNVGILNASLFIGTILLFQPWIGNISGQYYYDRLLLLPGLVLVLIIRGGWIRDWRGTYVALLCLLLCISISERGALLSSGFVIGSWILEGRSRWCRKGLLYLVAGVFGLIYVFLYAKYFQDSLYYSSMSITQIWQNLKSALLPSGHLSESTLKWFLIFVPYLILSFVILRNGLLAIMVIAPNFMVTVGGAEKIGFMTHYHAGYLPIIIALSAVGYATLINSRLQLKYDLKSSNIGLMSKFLPITILLYNIGTMVLYKGDGYSDYHKKILPNTSDRNVIKQRGRFLKEFVSHVPSTSRVSSPEWFMPALVLNGNRLIDYMPIGVGGDEYVIAEYVLGKKTPLIPSYLSDEKKNVISKCVQDRLDSSYTTEKKGQNNGMEYIIFKKINESVRMYDE